MKSQRSHILVNGFKRKEIRSTQIHLHVQFVFLCIVLKNLLAGFDDEHEMALVPTQEGSKEKFAFDDQLVHQTETKKSGNIVRTTFRVDPDHVLPNDGFLEVSAPEELSFSAVFGRFLLSFFLDPDFGSSAILNVLLFLLFFLFFFLFLLLFFFLQGILLFVEVLDLIEDFFDEFWEGPEEFGDGFNFSEDKAALFLFLFLFIAEDLQEFGVEVEVNHSFEIFPEVFVFVEETDLFVEAGEAGVLLWEHVFDDVLVFFIEHFFLAHLHVLLEGGLFDHLVEVVDLEEGVSCFVGSLVEVALVLQEVKPNHERNVLPFRLQTTRSLHIEKIVKELHCLPDLGEVVGRSQLPLLLLHLVLVDPLRRQVVRVGTLYHEVPQVGVRDLLEDLVHLPLLTGVLVVDVVGGTVDAELSQHVAQNGADRFNLSVDLDSLASSSNVVGVVSLLHHLPKDLVFDLLLSLFLLPRHLRRRLAFSLHLLPSSFGLMVPVQGVHVFSVPLVDIKLLFDFGFLLVLGFLLDHYKLI